MLGGGVSNAATSSLWGQKHKAKEIEKWLSSRNYKETEDPAALRAGEPRPIIIGLPSAGQ